MATSPQRFSGRAGSRSSGRLRRALDGAIDTNRRTDETMAVTDGRLGVNLARGGGLREGPRGLELDPQQRGEMNRSQMPLIKDLDSAATTAELVEAYNKLLFELRRSKRMR